jgi:hypothetical protein
MCSPQVTKTGKRKTARQTNAKVSLAEVEPLVMKLSSGQLNGIAITAKDP